MEDPREERSDGAAKAAEVHDDHEASVNQVGDQPFPASHDDERGQPAAGKEGAGPAPAPAAPARHDDDAADRDDSADSSQD